MFHIQHNQITSACWGFMLGISIQWTPLATNSIQDHFSSSSQLQRPWAMHSKRFWTSTKSFSCFSIFWVSWHLVTSGDGTPTMDTWIFSGEVMAIAAIAPEWPPWPCLQSRSSPGDFGDCNICNKDQQGPAWILDEFANPQTGPFAFRQFRFLFLLRWPGLHIGRVWRRWLPAAWRFLFSLKIENDGKCPRNPWSTHRYPIKIYKNI